MRWGIETFYGYVKEELQLGQFSGIRDICIRQDFAANLFLFNLQSLIEKQCEPYIEQVCKTRIYKYKVNKNISWASMKYGVVKLFLFEIQTLYSWSCNIYLKSIWCPSDRKKVSTSKERKAQL